MPFLIYLAFPAFVVALLVSFFLTPVVRRVALRYQIVDQPGSRKVHQVAVPLLGGIPIFIGFSVALVAHLPMGRPLIGVLIGGFLALCLGLCDDLWSIRPGLKILGQIGIGVLTYYSGFSIGFVSNPIGGGLIHLGGVALPITVLWIVAIMNTINLIDGLDGLAAGVVAISALFLCIVAIGMGQSFAALMAVAVVGASLGFLRFNFAPAQIFMGDSGAMFLGYMLSVISIIGVLKSTIAFSLLIPIIVLGVPIFDTIFAIFRRLRHRRALWGSDMEHIHHRLLRRGMSQRRATLFLYGGSSFLGVLAICVSVFTGLVAFLSLVGLSVVGGFLGWVLRKRFSS